MIYISSSCVKANKIYESVKILAENGFTNIELSGGTILYDDLESDLLQLQDQFNLNYLCHNYFPPPEHAFVLNLASLDDEIYSLSFQHLLNSINLSHRLGAKKFAFHAGFLINIPINQIGKSIRSQNLFNREEATLRFKQGVEKLIEHSHKIGLQLYIENNVLSQTNYTNFNETNPFLFTSSNSLADISINGIQPLIDFAHLKVSCTVLGLDLKVELSNLILKTDYIHLSDNDGVSDQNKEILPSSDLYKLLSKADLSGKVITLEIYDSLAKIKASENNLKTFLST